MLQHPQITPTKYEEFPEKILIVYTKSILQPMIDGNSRDGCYAFAAGSKSERLMKSAREWGGINSKEIFIDNTPKDIYLINYIYQSNGHILLKVISDGGFIFDLIFEEFWVNLNYGVAPSGLINTKFIWKQSKSEMRLVHYLDSNNKIIREIIE